MTSPTPEPATGTPWSRNPPPLTVAASVAAIEGGVLLVLALVELAAVSSTRLTMGLTTAVFFVVYGAGLLLCAWQLTRRASWARSPVLLTQLIQLGLAWSFRGGGTTVVAIALAVSALVVGAGLLHPDSMRALDGEPAQRRTPD